MSRYLVVGGAGFIGSYIVDRVLAAWQEVTIYDNFSSGREEHYRQHLGNSSFTVMRADVKDQNLLTACMSHHDVVVHLASNPDISRAVTDPDIDFREGTMLTRNVLEAMRLTGVRQLVYASSGGVYGDWGGAEVDEDHALRPIANYGASKVAGEAMISAYCHLFDFKAAAFRFANVVGGRQTHGVGLDFLRQLHEHPDRLHILGDGTQSKSYMHVTDVVDAIMLVLQHSATLPKFSVWNVDSGSYLTVDEIAGLAIEQIGPPVQTVSVTHAGGNRGWKGDVPVVRLNADRIRALGWKPKMNSREAMRRSLEEMRAGL